jgi:predicted outer membrane protein
MITDHTKAARQLQSAVSQSGGTVTLPTDLDPSGQARLDSLRNGGQNFDALYKQQMVAGHQEMYSLFQNYSSKPDANAAVKSVVVGLMPVVQQHLNSAKQLPGSGANSNTSR